jgi:hypothetical protein
MIWATRQFDADAWDEVRETFELHFDMLDQPDDMLLALTVPEPGRHEIWAGLPSDAVLQFYTGFERCEGGVPANSGLLVGNVAAFRRHLGAEDQD